MPAPAIAVESKAESAENPAVQRDFAGALSAMKLGRYKDAERMLLALTRIHPELSGPYANLGIVYFRLGKLPEATEALEKAIGINPDRAAYHNQLGIVYRQSGQLDKAREAYARALLIDSNYLNTHLNLGILYDLYLQEHDKALQHYERYQALLPSADVQVNKWIVDLKQRQQTADKTAMRTER
jgi:tetratricopeptide (TPR) repeat protein